MNLNFFDIVRSNVADLLTSKTKFDESFPLGQFKIRRFNAPFRLDRDITGRDIMLYVKENIPAALTIKKLPIACFYVELNLRKQKCLISCSYNPKKASIGQHRKVLCKSIDLYSSTYENVFL